MKAVIDKRKCASDNRICMPMRECPVGAISWIEDEEEPLCSRMEVDQDKCNGCGLCVPVCCGNCIEVC